MRVAMFSDSYYPYISGVTRAIHVARETLIGMGHDVSVFCPAYPGIRSEAGIHRLPSMRAPTATAGFYVALPSPLRLRRLLLEVEPDLIHIHSPFNLCKSACVVARRLDIPVVFTYHTMYNMYSHYVPVLGQGVSTIVEAMAIQVANSVDAVVTPSGVLAEYLRYRGVSSPLYPIANGIDVARLRSGNPSYLRNRLGVPSGTPVVLTCSRLTKEKNVGTLLRSFAKTAESSPGVLVLVGDGPEKRNLQALAKKLNISEKTYFAGLFPPEEMPHVYAGADLFLFASLTDTQGLVLVEAKSAGLPAVAVGALGVKDMVKDGDDGYLCENDASDLSRKTLRLLQNPDLLSTMKDNAKRNALSFSKEASATKLLGCYESVLD